MQECLDSILPFEKHFEIEIICIDDGSVDGTIELLKQYQIKHKNLFIYPNQGKGPGSARNDGIRLSSGDYIIFLDSDDFLAPGLLSELLKVDVRKFEMILFGFKLFEDKTNDLIFSSKVKGEINVKSFLRGAFPPAVWGKIIKREILIHNEIWFRERIKVEDVDFVLKMVFFTKRTINLKGMHYHWRHRASSESRTLDSKYINDYFVAMDTVYAFLQDRRLELKYRQEIVLFTYRYLKNLIKKIKYINIDEQAGVIKQIETNFTKISPRLRSKKILILKAPEIYREIMLEGILKIFPPRTSRLYYFSILRRPRTVFKILYWYSVSKVRYFRALIQR